MHCSMHLGYQLVILTPTRLHLSIIHGSYNAHKRLA